MKIWGHLKTTKYDEVYSIFMWEKFERNSIQNLTFPRNLRWFLHKNTPGRFYKLTGGGFLEKGLPLFIRTSAVSWCLSNCQLWPSYILSTATTSKGWRDGRNKLAGGFQPNMPPLISRTSMYQKLFIYCRNRTNSCERSHICFSIFSFCFYVKTRIGISTIE